MNILLTNLDKTILSFVIIVVAALLTVLLVFLIRKENKRYKKAKLLSIDDIVTHDDLLKLIEFRLSQDHQIYFSLFYVSIDQFDHIGEFVHEDGILKYLLNMGKILQMNLPKNAKFAQTEERETFLVYVPEVLDDNQLFDMAFKFKMALERKVTITQELSVQRTLTIAALTYPKDGNTLEDLRLNLKSALYHGKRLNGNTIAIYNDTMRQTEDSFNEYREYKRAIKDKKISLLFSPVFESEGKTCYGMDIKVVYQKQNKQLTYREFLPNLESNNDAFWFGNWVFEKAIKDSLNVFTTTKNKEFYTIIPISLEQLANEDFVSYVDTTIKKYQVDPAKVVFYFPVVNRAMTVLILKSIVQLKKLGFNFSIDYQTDEAVLRQLIGNFQIEFLKANIEVLNQEYDVLKKEYPDIKIMATKVSNVNQMGIITRKQIPFASGSYFQTDLGKDELVPFITKSRL